MHITYVISIINSIASRCILIIVLLPAYFLVNVIENEASFWRHKPNRWYRFYANFAAKLSCLAVIIIVLASSRRFCELLYHTNKAAKVPKTCQLARLCMRGGLPV